jgi:hypothetical protein
VHNLAAKLAYDPTNSSSISDASMMLMWRRFLSRVINFFVLLKTLLHSVGAGLTLARTIGSISSTQRAGGELGSSNSISEGIGVVRKGRFLPLGIRHCGFIYTTFGLGASHMGYGAYGLGQDKKPAWPARRVGLGGPGPCITGTKVVELLNCSCRKECERPRPADGRQT